MKVISLGSVCHVKFNIDRLFKQEETLFFDRLITDFKSVLYILKNINNEELITKQKFTCENIYMTKKNSDCHKIEHIDLKMISLHDFPSNIYYMECMDNFILKYNRRLCRFKNIIKSVENIHLIHCLDHLFTDYYIITNDDIINYKKYLCDINSNNNCFLHIVIPPEYNNIDLNHLIQDNVYVYYLHDTHQGNNDWTKTNFNWNVVFDNINTIG